MKNITKVLGLLLILFSIFGWQDTHAASHWVGTWATASQLVEEKNLPPSPGLTGNSLRQIVRVSVGGEIMRLRLTNGFSQCPVTMKSVQIAVSTGGHTIDLATNKVLKFSGKTEVTMSSGSALISDPISFKLRPRMDVAITIYFEQTSPTTTGHPGSRTTSFLLAGNSTKVTDFTGAAETDHWYVINGIDVLASAKTRSIAILGNSITDGRGSDTNKQNRWPDILSERLLNNAATRNIGVLNMGIGGNCMVSGGLGPTALNRYDRDILGQQGLSWVVIFIGVNDIGGTPNSQEAADWTYQNLINTYEQFIENAHAKGLKVYGGTIMPFKGNGYYSEFREACRNKVNEWIRTAGNFDACIDFDKCMQDPNNPASMSADLDFQNDFLHPNADGHRKMGEFIDLRLFE
jgi:lysophospholipase L1-like esterase